MKKSSYREQDSVFGQLMLTLRMAVGLTQQGLADLLGVSRNAVGGWEVGQSYPKAEHLKAFIVLALQQHVFAAGREAEEIRALWRAAHQKVLLDEPWLQELLSPQAPLQVEVATKPPSAGSSKERALWSVPHARNPHFTGRDELLEQLMQQLTPPLSGEPTTIRRAALTQAQVIKGLGGIGKTQTAVEYAYLAREQGRYTHTLWIAAATEESILMSLAALAEQLPAFASTGEADQRKLVAAVIRWLEQCQEPWLLIVDNADDLSLVQPYLPLKGNGSLLLTTRASAAGWLASSLEVDTMGVMEGTELLLRRAQRFARATDEEINEASNLVMALAQFPLALDQAGAYIEETGCSLSDYLQLYQTHRHALLARRGRQATQYPASVATTWSLSLQHVEETNPAAADLLRLCAFLAPDHIPEELLTAGAPYWPPLLQQAVADRFRFNQMLETLMAFSLMKRLAEDRLLSIHRLVQVVQVVRLSPEEQRQWAERLVRAINAVFPRDPQEVASWQGCQRYLEQVQACDTLIREQQILLPEAADVLDRAGTYLRERALYALAESLYQQALRIWEQQVMPDSVGRARSLNNLARLSFWKDKPALAESLHQQALRIREQKLGPEHLDVAESLHDLAGLYRTRGKYTEAEPLYQRALRIREQKLGPEHLMVAESVNGLAVLYKQQGKYAEAEPLYLKALRIREQKLGPEHLIVAESSNDLAVLYSSKGKHAEAEPLIVRALRIWEQQLEPEHPMVAYPLVNLALAYREQGEYAKAEPLYLRALHIREQQLGEAHPLVAFTLDGLAHLYSMQDKLTEAERLYVRSLHIREQQLGHEHRDVALSLRGLANLYTRQGKYMEAEPLYQRALRVCEQQLGPDHLETANILHDFAGFQQAQGQTQEAAVLYQRVLTIRETVLGPPHPGTNETRERLQAVLDVLSRTQEATQEKG